MTTYTYKIITPGRTLKEGSAEALAAFWVHRRLRREGNTVLFVKREGSSWLSSLSFGRYASLSAMERVLFFRNFAMMLDSGITIANILETLAVQVKGFGAKPAIEAMRREVMSGVTLSVAMSRYPSLFPNYIIKTIEVGEKSGTLSKTMDKISVDLEKAYELRRKLIGAIAYPTIIFMFMIATALMLIITILPQIINMFNELGAPMPKATVALNNFGLLLMHHPYQIVMALIVIFALCVVAMRNRTIRYNVHAFTLRLPIFGKLIKEYNLAQFTRALATLLASGITFVHALDTGKGTIKNEAYVQNIEKLYPIILHGGVFSDSVRMTPFYFPEQLRQLVHVGEQSGKLRESFEKASQHYERSVAFQTQMLTTLLEPILMLIAGLLVGFLAYSIFAPLYQIATII